MIYNLTKFTVFTIIDNEINIPFVSVIITPNKEIMIRHLFSFTKNSF